MRAKNLSINSNGKTTQVAYNWCADSSKHLQFLKRTFTQNMPVTLKKGKC